MTAEEDKDKDREKYYHPNCPHPSTKEWHERCSRNKDKSIDLEMEEQINSELGDKIVDLILETYKGHNVDLLRLARTVNLAFFAVVFSNHQKFIQKRIPPSMAAISADMIAMAISGIFEEFGINKGIIKGIEGLK